MNGAGFLALLVILGVCLWALTPRGSAWLNGSDQ